MCEEKTKKCSKCGVEYPLTREYFYCDKRTKDGFLARCKQCKDQADKEYRAKNPEKIAKRRKELYDPEKAKVQSAQYRETHKEELKVKKKQYYDEHRDEILEQKKVYHQEHKEDRNAYNRQYAEEHKEELKEYAKDRYEREKEKILAQHKVYYLANSDKIKKRVAKYRKENKVKVYECNRRYYATEAGIESNRRARHKRKARESAVSDSFTLEQWQVCQEYFDHKCAYCGEEKKLTQDHFIPVSKDGPYTVFKILPSCKNCNSSKQDFDFNEWYPEQPYFSEKRLMKIYKYLSYDGKKHQLSLEI